VGAEAQALPFGEAEFDVVTSSFGAIFAPDHQRVADELLRVCRPGGTIGLTTFPPGGLAEEIFGVVAPYMPPPPPVAPSPLLWGTEEHVRQLFGDRIESLEMSERTYTERAPSPQEYVDLYKETFGPVVSVYEALRDQPDRTARLDREFLDFAHQANRGARGGWAEYPYEYLLLVARKQVAGPSAGARAAGPRVAMVRAGQVAVQPANRSDLGRLARPHGTRTRACCNVKGRRSRVRTCRDRGGACVWAPVLRVEQSYEFASSAVRPFAFAASNAFIVGP
jgi:Methyltransferase domain